MTRQHCYYKVTTKINPTLGGSINQNFNPRTQFMEERHPLLRLYAEGLIVKAWKSTPGIFFFSTQHDAAYFAKSWMSSLSHRDMILFKVKPIGKVSKQKFQAFSFDLDRLTSWRKFARFMRHATLERSSPQGTFTAPAVRVVERVPDDVWADIYQKGVRR